MNLKDNKKIVNIEQPTLVPLPNQCKSVQPT